MPHTVQNGYSEQTEAFGEQAFAETPFVDPRIHEQEEPLHESLLDETLAENWEFVTPFLPGESTEARETEAVAPEVAEFSEITAELKDTLFREALEQLADEALEANISSRWPRKPKRCSIASSNVWKDMKPSP